MPNDLITEYANASGNDATGPGGDPPANYKPVSPEERQQWNQFIRYLNNDKKVGGDKSLDDKDKSKGLEYLEEYRKKNPGFSITADMIPNIQYEFNLMRDVNALPDQANLNPYVKTIIKDYYPPTREISPVDGWLGSLTSKQAYPEIQEFTDDPIKKKYGLDYKGASDYADKFWTKKSK